MPRTYDKSIPEGKESAFRLTSTYGREFGQDFNRLLSKHGQTIIHRNIEAFEVRFMDITLE